jgi:hypothetical protein
MCYQDEIKSRYAVHTIGKKIPARRVRMPLEAGTNAVAWGSCQAGILLMNPYTLTLSGPY